MRDVYTLTELEEAIRASWGLDTADADNDWTPENPSCGQCDVTSLVVHDLLGGELLGSDVYLDGERVEGHMWNRLASGIEVDLTRDQSQRGEAVGEPVVHARPQRSIRPTRATTATRAISSWPIVSALGSGRPVRSSRASAPRRRGD